MNKIIGLYLNICVISLLAMASGCATMDRSECQVANWEIIGLEDGSAGRATSYIGEHRSACAEYAVTPDLKLYLKGHKRGIIQYCTYQSGFNLGERGNRLSNVCAETNSKNFNRGYHQGKKHYTLKLEIKKLNESIHHQQDELAKIETAIKLKEDVIVTGQTSHNDRRQLLEDIKNLRADADAIEHALTELESLLFRAEDRFERLNSNN